MRGLVLILISSFCLILTHAAIADNASPIDAPPGTSVQSLKDKAENGDAASQANLGFMYLNGTGVPKDYNEAMKWWGKASSQGNLAAQTAVVLVQQIASQQQTLQQQAQQLQWYQQQLQLLQQQTQQTQDTQQKAEKAAKEQADQNQQLIERQDDLEKRQKDVEEQQKTEDAIQQKPAEPENHYYVTPQPDTKQGNLPY